MYLTGHLYKPTNTGGPDYNICGQAPAVLDFTGLKFKVSVSKDGSPETLLFNFANLAAATIIAPITINYGIYDLYFDGFDSANIDSVTGTFQLKFEIYKVNTANRVTWEKFNVHIEVSKSGYESFNNTFELYNYDVGNEVGNGVTVDVSGNKDFDIYLIDDTNNLVNGIQTKAFSKVLALRHPFTNEVYFYNTVGTQGSIKYYNGVNQIGSGNRGTICNKDTITITETITLNNNEECSSEIELLKQIWIPELIIVTSCDVSCSDCVNDNSEVKVKYYLDFTNVSVVNLDGSSIFVTQFLTEQIVINIYDYLGNIIQTLTDMINPDYATWFADPSFYLTYIEQSFIPSEIGDNVIKSCNKYTAGFTID